MVAYLLEELKLAKQETPKRPTILVIDDDEALWYYWRELDPMVEQLGDIAVVFDLLDDELHIEAVDLTL